MSILSGKMGQDFLHYDSHEETSSCTCFLIGFRRKNQVLNYSHSSSTSETGNKDSEELFEINLEEPLDTISEDCESSVFSFDIHNEKDIIHVAVGQAGESSMEALLWTLNHAVTPSTTVCFIHVFPQIRLIPTPFGKIPRNFVDQEYVNFHLTQEKCKRKELLQRFIDLCTDSKVKVEIMLTEGDNISKAIVDLVRNLGIRKLVIGTSKSNLSKHVSRRRNAIADKVLKNAPETCDVKIICDGTEVIDQMIVSSSSLWSSCGRSSRVSQEEAKSHGFVHSLRFMPNRWLSRFLTQILIKND